MRLNLRRLAPRRMHLLCRVRQNGFDLIQISIVLVVIGALMAGAYAGVPPVLARLRAAQEAQDLTAYARDQDIMPISDLGDITSAVCKYRLYPEPACAGNGEIRNRFGGAVRISRAVNNGTPIITVTSANVPSRACHSLVPMVGLTFDAISITSAGRSKTYIKEFDAISPMLQTNVYELCHASPFVTLHYQFRAL